MIRFFCDMCGQKRPKDDIFGVRGITGGTCFLTTQRSDEDYLGAVQDCEKHICKDCLKKIGWKEKEEKA